MRLAPCAWLVATCVGWAALAQAERDSLSAGLVARVQGTPELSKLFGASPEVRRAGAFVYTSIDQAQDRVSLVAFDDHGRSGSSLGSKFCHAALGAAERRRALEPLVLEFSQDPGDAELLRQALEASASVSLNMKNVRERSYSGATQADPDLRLCSVKFRDIEVGAVRKPAPAELAESMFLLGKKAYSRGDSDNALSALRYLRRHPDHYQNALPLIIVLLENSHPEIARELFMEVLEPDAVTDPMSQAALSRLLDSEWLR